MTNRELLIALVGMVGGWLVGTALTIIFHFVG